MSGARLPTTHPDSWTVFIGTSCTQCLDDRTKWCRFCGSCVHDPHTEECQQAWRDLILSY